MRPLHDSALAIAHAIATGEKSAREVTLAALNQVAAGDGDLNCFTAVTAERALVEADAVDTAHRRGEVLGPLAGAPYAVKNLYDVAGLTTLAGARLFANRPPAHADAPTVAALRSAGAILIGATNMDAYAYGFTTENSHYGVTRNPIDPSRIAGGSSGGAAAAVAAGMVSFSLGSDTNGSIRVPASFCGVFGIKPTYGRLPRDGTQPFVDSLDHIGAFARHTGDLACIYDILQTVNGADPAFEGRPASPTLPTLEQGVSGLRFGILGGHFERWADKDAKDAVRTIAEALGTTVNVELQHADLARTSAFLMTAAEGGARYLPLLRTRADDFEPRSRERLVAGGMLPSSWYLRAQRFRAWFRAQASLLFHRVDVLIAPSTPCIAPAIGTETICLDGKSIPWRPNVGLLTQPISFVGLPVVSVPVQTSAGMPIGVQIIAAPWREDLALRCAWHLENIGMIRATCTAA